LKQYRNAGDRDAEQDARQQPMQLLDQIIVPCELDADRLALAGADRDVSRGDRSAFQAVRRRLSD
jgi:hypothetical protein